MADKYALGVEVKRIFLIFWLLVISCSSAVGQENRGVVVTVSGLDETLRNNVLARLSLVRQKDNPQLTDAQVRRLVTGAKQEIASSLEPFGYYSPDIQTDLQQQDNSWQARFTVVLGEPVRAVRVAVELDGPGTEDEALQEVAARFPLQSGDVLDHRLYEQGKKNLTSTALAAGYLDVSFSRHVVEVDRSKHSAGIHLVLDTGPRYLFGATTLAADFLNHSLLKRILPYAEGDPFSAKALVALRQSLLGSEYFSSVDVKSGQADPAALKVPVEVILSPASPNTYGFGLGYGTDTGARGSVEWTNRRLNRYGHQFNLQAQPSERKSSFGGVYTIPVRDPRKDRLSLLAKWEKEDFAETKTEQRTVSTSYDHVGNAWEYSLYLAFLDEDYDAGVDTGHATLLTPGIKTTWRLADDRLKTKRGVRVTVNLTGSNENLLSDATFVQPSLSAKGIFAFFEEWRLLGRLQVGGTVIDNIYDLPPSLRFYAGGDQSVRGFGYKSIGPTDVSGNVIGGRYLMTYSVELERSLTETWSAALFFDSGDAFNSLPDLAMKSGVGVGLRWNAPFGQIRIDLAHGFSEGGGAWRIHFTVGADL